MSVTLLALSLSLSYGLWSSFNDARAQRVRNLRSLVDLTVFNLQAPLAFEDADAAKTTLESLRFEKSIKFASLRGVASTLRVYYTSDGEPTRYIEAHRGKLNDLGEEIGLQYLVVVKEVVFQGKIVGELFVYSSLDDLYAQLFDSSLKALAAFLFSLGIAAIVAHFLQKRITKPLSDLLFAIEEIEQNKDYSKRLPVRGADEFSILMTRFNEMLEEVEKRDKALEDKVLKRTLELREALGEAEAANRAKSQFLANMSHEMRTPLTGIIGMISILKEFRFPKEERELFDMLASSADTLLSVINDVLDFSKIESGRVEIEEQPFKFTELVDTIRKLILFQTKEKGITYIEDFGLDEGSQFVGDSLRIRQVLLNLTSNALKFTTPGGAVIVRSWKERITQNHSRLYFAVADTGIGVSKSKLETIFNAFTQADGSTTRKFGGTGLGLAISKQLVQLMQGQISAKSIETVGSCFSFYVTVSESLGQTEQFVSSRQLSDQDTNKVALRILVAEDNRVNQKLAKRLLESENHDVTIANDGKEATELLEQQHFDLILMDVQMPVMDGLEATRRIRRMSGEKGKVPILGVSAHAFREIQERSVSTGMTGYLTKPFKKKDLLESISKVMKEKSLKDH
ncbi:MAG: response regulator [Bdellovibrionales bacterium]|nr:response regulator [Bdellovibrionales bacterium]